MTPKSIEKNEIIRKQSRASIMQAALELFAKKGYGGTSISQIAKEANISKGLMYNYFESKEALLKAIIEEAVHTGEMIIKSVETTVDPKERLAAMVEQTISIVKSNLHYWKLITSLAFQEDAISGFQELIRFETAQNLKKLEEIFRQMGHSNPKMEAMLFGAILDGMLIHYIHLEETYPLDDLKDFLIEKYCN